MRFFKEIKFRNIILYSFITFTVLATFVILFSAFDSYKKLKLYNLKDDFIKLSMNYVYIDKNQDQLLVDSKNKFWAGLPNYKIIKSKLNNSISVIDSIVAVEKISRGKLNRSLIDLKQTFISYNKILTQIYDLNTKLYEPTLGLNSKNKFLIQRTYNEKRFKRLGLLKFFDQLLVSSNVLINNGITKKDYQKTKDKIFKEMNRIDISKQDEYFFLLFQDHFADYYNNTLLEYSKLREIGFNYNEGLMKVINARNKEIKRKIEDLNTFIDKKFKRSVKIFFINYFVILLFINVFIFIIFLVIYRIIYTPWKKMEPFLKKFAKGELQEIDSDLRVKELKLISETFNRHVDKLKEKREIIDQLARRNYSYEFSPESYDEIGISILQLRNDLLKSEEEAISFRETEENQKWAANGIAKIGAVMRQFTNDIEQLSQNILNEIIQYVNAVQGALYLYNAEKEILELTTYYSYGKQRIKHKEIRPYEGIIGTILIEKREYYFADIPDDYIFIETGLGRAKPKSLFVFPLLFENQIYGIIELSFLDNFPEYVREFILSLANEIAITISYTQINVQTNLLLEQSEKQAKNLQSNEKLYKKNQDNLKSLLRMAEQKLSEKENEVLYKEELLRQKVTDILNIEKELSEKEEYIETIVNEYENVKSALKNQNEELRKRIEELEKRLREKED